MDNDFSNCWLWITGASSGIGRALAEALLKQGANCIISARNEAALTDLQQTYPKQCFPMPLDVTDAEQIKATVTKIWQLTDKLDYVILNAGICEYIDVKQFDSDLLERVFNTNLFGCVRCTEAILPKLLAQNSKPLLVYVGSSAAYLPLPRAEAYGASKAALGYFARSLRIDLAKHGIDVSVVEPGFVKTPLTDQNDFAMPMRISSEEAAIKILKGLKRRKKTIHFPKAFTGFLKCLSLLPEGLQFYLVKRIKEPS